MRFSKNCWLSVLFFCLPLLCFSSLKELLKNPQFDWMDIQIADDLSYFKDADLTPAMVDETLHHFLSFPDKEINYLCIYKIKNNKIMTLPYFNNTGLARVQSFVKVLEYLAVMVDLPDVEFIMSHGDYFNRPAYLVEAKVPVFNITKLRDLKKIALIPDCQFFFNRWDKFNDIMKESYLCPWEEKFSIAFWRGAPTGFYYYLHPWDLAPRTRLIVFSKNYPDDLDAAFVEGYFYLESPIREWVLAFKALEPYIPSSKQLIYKYLIAVDGSSFPSNLAWSLFSNSVVLKNVTECIEWYHNALIPYVHYVPYKQDCSDLKEQIEWLRTHDAEAKQIAEQATDWAQEHLSNEAILVYLYKLLTNYADLFISQ